MPEHRSRVRWWRVLIAGILVEVMTIAAVILATLVYSTFSGSELGFQDLGKSVGYYVAPLAGTFAAFLFGNWASRKADSAPILHGALVGALALLLTVPGMIGAEAGDQPVYVVAGLLKLVAASFGGWRGHRSIVGHF